MEVIRVNHNNWFFFRIGLMITAFAGMFWGGLEPAHLISRMPWSAVFVFSIMGFLLILFFLPVVCWIYQQTAGKALTRPDWKGNVWQQDPLMSYHLMIITLIPGSLALFVRSISTHPEAMKLAVVLFLIGLGSLVSLRFCVYFFIDRKRRVE